MTAATASHGTTSSPVDALQADHEALAMDGGGDGRSAVDRGTGNAAAPSDATPADAVAASPESVTEVTAGQAAPLVPGPAAAGAATTDAPAAHAASVVAVVREGGAHAKIVRDGQARSVKPGDVILEGDVIGTDGDGTVKLEFTGQAQRGTGDKPMSVTIGANSNLLIRAEAAEGSAVSMKVLGGAIAVENSPVEGSGVSIDTPFGRVVARGQGVGISVGTSETTVLPIGSRPAGGTQNDGVWVQSAGGSAPVGVASEGTVLHAAAAERPAEVPSAAQAGVITSLVTTNGSAAEAPAVQAAAAPAVTAPAAATLGNAAAATATATAGVPASTGTPSSGSTGLASSPLYSGAALAPISGATGTMFTLAPAALAPLPTYGLIGHGDAAAEQAPETQTPPPVIPYILMGSITVDESAGFANVTITLSAVTTQIITLTVSVTGSSDGRVASGVYTITIPAGDDHATLSLPIATDTVRQADSTIDVTITSVQNGIITQGEATVLVQDAAPMVAGPGDTVVTGGAGDDVASGSTGNDTLDGGAGSDSISGGAGNDVALAGAGDDFVDGGQGSDVVSGGEGTDTVLGGDSDDTGDDSVDGGDGSDSVEGGLGNDSATGGAGDDSVDGGSGDDVVDGGEGGDVVLGGLGDDTVAGGDDADTGNDTVDGGAGNDWVTGGAGDDIVSGGDGSDTGNDTLDGGAGRDSVSGGLGDDLLVYDADDLAIDGGSGTDTLRFKADANLKTDAVALSGIEVLDLRDSAGGSHTGAGAATRVELSAVDVRALLAPGTDVLRVEGDAGDNVYVTEQWMLSTSGATPSGYVDYSRDDGQGGTVTLRLAPGVVLSATLTADPAGGTLTGGTGGDAVVGGSGNDSASGGLGDDSLDGAAGNDVVDGGDGNDVVSGGDGLDTVTGGDSNDTVDGGDGADAVSGGLGNDLAKGGAGDDSVDGGAGDDTVDGGLGNDLATGGIGNDSLDGGAGNDTVDGGQGDDVVAGGLGNDSVGGGTGNDTVDGGQGDDWVGGGAGNDTVSGGDGSDTGSDTLDGGAGSDSVGGGQGDDLLVYDADDVAIDGGAGTDALRFKADANLRTDAVVLASIEVLDLRDSVGNTGAGTATRVELAATDVRALLASGTDVLRVEGDAGDNIYVTEQWTLSTSGATPSGYTDYSRDDGQGGTVTLRLAPGVVLSATLTADPAGGTLTGGTGGDAVVGGSGNDSASGGLGDDSLDGAAGDDVVDGGDGNDVVSGGDGLDIVTGGDSNDTVDGGTGSDSVSGGLGNDLAQGGAGDDSVDGGAGDDTVDGGLGDDLLSGGLGDDTVMGGDGSDTGNDTLDGGAGSDSVSGAQGDDLLVYDANDQAIDGGAGTDTLHFKADANLKTDAVVVTNIEVLDLRDSGGHTGAGTATRVELAATDVRALLASGTDVLRVEGDAGDNIYVTEQWTLSTSGATPSGYTDYSRADGQGGTVTLRLASGVVLSATLTADPAGGTLTGGTGGDAVVGGSGNDSASGGLGDDSLDGAAGDDVVDGGDGNDVVSGGDGLDTVTGGNDNDTVDGGAGSDSVNGGLGNDLAQGGAGNDSVDGGAGDDTVDGGLGDDLLSGGLGDDTIMGGDSSDTGNDTLDGGAGSDSLSGGQGDDLLVYDADDLFIDGGAGTDTLRFKTDANLKTDGVAITSIEVLDLRDAAGNTGAGTATRVELAATDVRAMLASGTDVLRVEGDAGDNIYVTEQWTLSTGGATPAGYTDYSRDDGQGGTVTLRLAPGVVLSATLTADPAGGTLTGGTLTGGTGGDAVVGGTGNDSASGGLGDDSLDGAAGDDVVDGGQGDDVVGGGDGLDTVTGGDDNDTVDGGADSDSVDGGLGNDLAQGGVGNDSVDGGAGDDTVDGGLGDDLLGGGLGDDTVTGGDGSDTGNDTLDGGAGSDSVSGGLGDDLLVYDANDQAIDGGAGTDTLRFKADANLKTDGVAITSIEVLDLRDSAGNTGAGTATRVELSAAEVREVLATGTTTLRVEGDSGDEIYVTEEWTPGSTSGGTTSYSRVHNGETLTLQLASGVNLVATLTITGANTASLTETHSAQTASGTLAASYIDEPGHFIAQSGAAGSNGHGTFSIDAAGAWTYTMDSAHDEFVAGATYTDSLTVSTVDGTTRVLTVTMTGTNDAAVITGSSTASLTETNAAQSASGTLSAADVDSAATFVAQTLVAGSNGHGTFSIDAAGAWTYAMDSAHNAFVNGATYTDSLTVATADGTTQVITVTMTGSNDAAVITGSSTAGLTETNAVQGTGGTLAATDVDSAATFVAQTFVAGSNGYGSFSIDTAGAWTYTMDSAHDEFVGGATYTDSLTVATADGTTQVITVTMTGSNDAAVITGSSTASLTETNTAQSTSGTLGATDVDSATTFVAQTGAAGSNGYGTFSIDTAGAWAYTMDNAHDEFEGGATYTDSLTVATADGTTQVITVTMTGSNDAAVITGSSTASLTETNAVQSTGGTLAATDVDSAATFVAQTFVAGSNGYGSFSIDTAGAWTYTMDSAHDEFVGGATHTDSLTVASADGTTQVITVTMTGSNDAAVITGSSTASLTETNAAQGTGGTLAATDVDSAATFVAQTGVAGSNGYGTFSIDTAGAWTYTMDSAHDEFEGGATYTDSLTVATADGTTQVITVTMAGSNDAAVITGSSTASLTETDSAQSTGGTLSVADVDNPATFVAQTSVAGSNGYGTFSIDTAGAWTYTMGSARNEFVNGVSYTDSITVASADGTTQLITVTMTGSSDTQTGTAGDDVFTVVDATDTVVEALNEGNDEVRTSLASFTLSANVEKLSFTSTADATGTGNALANTITGNTGNDSLAGAAGNDTITGLAGNDTLDGGTGADSLVGGADDDLYLIDDAGDTVVEQSGQGTDEVRASLAAYTLTANVERLVFTSGSNATGTGNSSANTITGNAGHDSLAGAAGDDTVTGGIGNDTLDGGTGNDSLAGGDGNDTYFVDAAGDVVVEAASEGTDEVRTTLTSYTLADKPDLENLAYTNAAFNGAGASAFTGTGNDAHNAITGGNASDSLSGAAGNDTLAGGAGADTLDGGSGADSLVGGTGNDVYIVDDAGDSITEATSAGTDEVRTSMASYTLGAYVDNLVFTAGANATGTGNDEYNVITGNSGDDTLSGGAGLDTLSGGAGNDSLDGGADNDTLAGGAGNDVLAGGTGSDTADYGSDTNGVVASLVAAGATDGSGGTDSYTSIENLTGGSGADSLAGDAGANRLDGGSGNDTITGGAGSDTLVGGSGTDTLDYSSHSAAVIANMSGSTVSLVAAGTASDGLGGTDSLSGFENIQGGAGNDTLVGSTGDNLLAGNSGNDVLWGDAGNDTLQGGAGDDSLRGGTGNDTLDGGAQATGGDTADYSDQGTAVTASLLGGTATGGSIGTDTLANLENLSGSSANDTLTGDANANQLWGNGGNDTLAGGAGNDTLRGGQGNDSIDGGADSDTLSYNDINGPVIVNLGASTLSQTVRVSGVDYAYNVAANTAQAVTQAGANAGTDTLADIENVVGSGGADTIVGSSGDNVIDGADGGDSLMGGAGDDTIYYDENDALADGGTGTADALVVKAGTGTLDLTLVRDEVFVNFDILDITDSGIQFVKISNSDVLAMTGGQATGTLIINGGSEDNVRLVGANWPTSNIPTEVIGSTTYNVYTYNGATLKIQAGITVGYLFQSNDTAELTNASGGSDIYSGNGGNDTLNAGAGDDDGDGGSGDDRLVGDAGNDTLRGGSGDDTVYGGDASDSNGSGNDSLDGGAGHDLVHGADGSDTLLGGDGSDTLDGGSGSDSLDGGAGDDHITAGTGDDTVDAGAGNDAIDAGDGANLVDAGIGDDTVTAGTGNDTLDGNSGADTVDYSAQGSAVTVNLATQTANGSGIGSDVLQNFEHVIGGAGADDITGSDAANRVVGGGGSDTVRTGAGNDWIAFDTADTLVDAGVGTDTLAIETNTPVDFTGIADDRFVGIEELDLTAHGVQELLLAGADVLAFSDSTDTLKIHGDAGDKVTLSGNWVNAGTQPVSYNGGASQPYVKLTLTANGTTATVLVDPEIALDVVYLGGSSNDTLTGGAGADSIEGGAGNDSLDGGAGADSVYGGDGTDTVIYDEADALADGGNQTDTLKFATGASGMVLDFSDPARPALNGVRPTLTGFEIIDITGGGANTVVIDSDSVIAMSDTDSIDITGNAGDKAYLVGSWVTGATAGGYTTYTKDGATVRIATAVTVGAVVDDPNGDSDSADPIPGATGGADVIRGLGGNDTLNGGAGADVLRGGAGDDRLDYDASDIVVDGGDGTDTLRVAANLNLSGVAGNTVTDVEVVDLQAGSANVTLTATGADAAAMNSAATVQVDGDASDTVALSGNWVAGATAGGYAAYTLSGARLDIATAIVVNITYSGNSLANTLVAGAGNQTVDALAGNDSLDGGAGNDTLLGGSGDDVLVYDEADGSISGGTGTDTLQLQGAGRTIDLTDIANPLITGIEKLDIVGTGNNTLVANADDIQALSTESDMLIVTGDVGDSVRLAGSNWEARGSQLLAGVTYNKFIGYATDGSLVTVLGGLKMVKGDQIVGSNSGEALVGSTGSDDIRGMGGNDTLTGGTGIDIMDGGSGDDLLVYDALDATLAGGADNDTLQVDGGGEIIDLQDSGRPATDAIRPGLSGFETIDLNTTGANVLVLDEASLSALAGGTLTVNGTAADIVFVDGTLTSALVLNGGVTQTALTRGTSGDDTLTGTAGQDAIKVDGGNDSIDGGAGADLVYAGAGDDRVLYDAADLRLFGEAGTDTLAVAVVDADGGIATTTAGTNSSAGDVDLSAIAGSIVKGFEVVDLRGNGNQTIKLDELSVQAMSDTDHVTILGDLGDVLNLYGGWVASSMESDEDGNIYTVLQKDAAFVHVISEVTLRITNELGGSVAIGSSAADDVLVATNGGAITGDGDDIIRMNNMSFTGVDGGRGYDKVYFQFSGSINTPVLSPTSLTNIEEIDLSAGSSAANKLILTEEKLAQMTDADHTLIVKGTAGVDTIDIYGQWSDIATAPDAVVNGVTYKLLTASDGGKLYYTPGMVVTQINPTQQVSAFSFAYDDGATLVSAGIDKYAGWKVENAGDVNKDGIDDIIVNQLGSAFVVFGTASMTGQFDLNNLGSQGFKINGVGPTQLQDYADWKEQNYGLTSIGDVNGDGIDDMLASTTNTNTFRVIYGRTTWGDIDLTDTNTFVSGSGNGFTITTSGFWNYGVLNTISGVGDVNGDGYDDYTIACMWGIDITGATDSGKMYLVFGGAYAGNINANAMATTQGVIISSDPSNITKLGADIAAIGDINADGFDDFAVGGPGIDYAGPNGQQDRSGSGFIVFGKAEGWGNSIVVQRDNTAPTMRTAYNSGYAYPADNATNVSLTQNPDLHISFTETVAMGTGYVSLYNTATGALVEKFDMATGLGSLGGRASLNNWGNVTNDSLQIFAYNPLSPSTSYHVIIDPTAIKDLAGNYFSGISSATALNFTTTGSALSDVTAPTLNATAALTYSGGSASVSTSSGSTGIVVAPTDTSANPPVFRMDFTFNENIKPYGTISVSQGGVVLETFDLQSGLGTRGGTVYYPGNNNSGAQNTNVYGINFGTTFAGNTLTTVTLSGMQDLAGNAFNGGVDKTFTYTTAADATGPVLTNTSRTHTPTDGATVVSVENNIVFQADETLRLGSSGSIELRLSASYNGTPTETFSWSGAQTPVNGVYTIAGNHGGVLTVNNKTVTLNPGANLAYSTGYDVYVAPGSLTDQSGNSATGYTTQGGFNFTTTSGLLTVAGGNAVDGSLKVGVSDNLEITFSESVTAGTSTPGSQFIRLYSNTGKLVEAFDVADGDGSNGTQGGNVSFAGYKVIINAGHDLALAAGYYITVDSQAVKSLNAASTTYYAGVNNTTTLDFSTEAAVQIDPGQVHNDYEQQWAGQQIEGVGDVDGDGVTDFVVGSFQTVRDYSIAGNYAYGKFYLVFGEAGTWPSIQNIQQLKDAGRAVEIYGTSTNRLTRVVEFGDLNQDGFDDLLLTAGGRYPDTDANPVDRDASNDGDTDSGAAFVVFGKARANWTAAVSVDQLGTDGLEITGGLPQEQLGFSAASGDFNNDGVVDMVFGMPVNHRDGYASGEVFVLNGGDYSDSVSSVGTSGDNTILGDFNANRISGQQGNDIIYGLGGADILRGGAGNDTVGISDLDFTLIDGGTGTDTLKFVGHGISLDMTGYAGASLRSFETIDLTGDGNNSLVINYNEVTYLLERQLASSYGTNVRLTIDGNAGDSVTLEGPWAAVGSDATYTTYALDGLYVRVDTDVTRTVAGWTIPYAGATLDLMALPAGMRTSTVTSGVGMDTGNGSYLANIGDVNNDGFADFALRQDAVTQTNLLWYQRYEDVYWENGNTVWGWYPRLVQRADAKYSGEAYVVYGKAGGLGTVNLASPTGGNAIKLTGSASANENLGSYLNGLGDINGDGVSDMVIGASQSSKTFTFNEGGEKSGSDTDGSNPTNSTARYQTAPNSASLSPDWNSDGWTQSNEGRQYFFLGNNTNLVNRTGGAITDTTLANDFNASTAIPTTYNVNSGLITDLPDRGPANAESNTIYTYTTTATKADGSFIGSANAQLGSNWQPVSVGDMNADGFDDFITGTSTTRLVLGSATGWTGFDNTSNSWTQKTVTINGNQNNGGISAAGDVNGDGYSDFVMSWDGNGALLVFGKSGTNWNATTTLNATTAATATVAASTFIAVESGGTINPTYTRGLGDINGDGYDDLLFAANSSNDYSAKDNGGAYVMFGSASGWGSNLSLAGLAAAGKGFRITGAVDFDYAGYDATSAGDVNGDGFADFLIAAYGDDESANGTSGAGSAYLVFGKSTGWADISLAEVQEHGIQILGGAQTANHLWQQLGDVDGDGLDDLGYASPTGTTILYGSEAFTKTRNVGVQHLTDANDSSPGDLAIDGGGLGATRGANAADTLIGNAGADTLVGDGGRDVLIGGAGNDLMQVADGNFFKLDGGTGIDTAELTATASVDFTLLPNTRIENIEVLELGNGDQAVTLSALDVLAMTDQTNTAVDNSAYQKGHVLVIDSDTGNDSVTFSDGNWASVATNQTVGSAGSFTVYQHGSDNIYAVVEDGITVSP